MKLWIVLEVDQFLPPKVIARPELDTAWQNVNVTHDTEISIFGPAFLPGIHRVPLKVRICPSRFTATQNFDVTHDTLINLSLTVPVVDVCLDDHDLPLNVAIVLGVPGNPLAPTVAQKVLVGQETV